MARGLSDVKIGNADLLNALRKLWNQEEGVMVWGMVSSVEVKPIVRFHGDIKPVFMKNFFARTIFPIYAKRQLKLQYLYKTA